MAKIMTMMRRRLALAAMALSMAFAMPAAADLDPQAVANDLVARNNTMITELNQLRDEGKLTQRAALALMRRHASAKLDFAKLTKNAMGKNWRRADEDARAQLVHAFRQLLENTYAKILASYGGQEVKLASASSRAKGGASVILEVQGERQVKMEYICGKVGDGEGDYAVSDIKVEGVSLVANYRRQFGAVIKKSGINGLIEEMRKKAAERAPKDE